MRQFNSVFQAVGCAVALLGVLGGFYVVRTVSAAPPQVIESPDSFESATYRVQVFGPGAVLTYSGVPGRTIVVSSRGLQFEVPTSAGGKISRRVWVGISTGWVIEQE
jgi:hypothetical protein